MSKVVLINPAISAKGFDCFNKDNYIQHGIAYIAAYLNKYKIDTDYIDLRMCKDWNDLFNRIIESNGDVFGISSMTVDFDIAIKVARYIKKKLPKSKVIIGGIHVTLVPEDGLKNKSFDYVVTGEGEKAMLKLVNDIENKVTSKRLIRGEPVDLEEIPHINRDMFYHREGEMKTPLVPDLKTPFATIMTSRGCPYNCAFCQPAERMVFQGRVRLRKISDVVDEIAEIKKKYGLKSYLIHDDLFLMQKERLEEFVKLMKKKKLKINFICQGRADLIIKLEKEIKKLKQVGLWGIMIGFESGSQRVLDFINKNTKVEDNLKSAKICHKLGIKIWANYMMGIPTESYREMWQTMRMIKKIDPEYHSPSFFTPYPQTRLFDYCKEHKLFLFKRYSEYRRGLEGTKIKGFNYNLMRAILFTILPWSMKKDALNFILKKLHIKHEV